jgi:hypothetical protein
VRCVAWQRHGDVDVQAAIVALERLTLGSAQPRESVTLVLARPFSSGLLPRHVALLGCRCAQPARASVLVSAAPGATAAVLATGHNFTISNTLPSGSVTVFSPLAHGVGHEARVAADDIARVHSFAEIS